MKTITRERHAAQFARNAAQQLEKMLKTHTFDQLLEDGDLYDIEGARQKLGYSAWGLRRLCRRGGIAHIMRGDQYFFLASQVNGAFKIIQAKP